MMFFLTIYSSETQGKLQILGTLMTGKNLTQAQVNYIRQQQIQQLKKQQLQAAAANAEAAGGTTTTTRTVTGETSIIPLPLQFNHTFYLQPQQLLAAQPL